MDFRRESIRDGPLGLASSYAAMARSSYKKRFFEIIELMMVNDNLLVEAWMNARSATEADSHGRLQETFLGTITIN